MKIKLLILLTGLLIVNRSYACEQDSSCHHEYDPEVIAEFEQELLMEDEDDDYLYFVPTHEAQIIDNLREKRKKEKEEQYEAYCKSLYQKIDLAFDQRAYKKCLEYIGKYKTARPKDAAANQNLDLYKAYCYMYLEKYEQAIDYFEEAIPRFKNHPTPQCLFQMHFNRAYCYYALGKTDKAKEKLAKLVDLNLTRALEHGEVKTIRVWQQPCMHPRNLNNAENLLLTEIMVKTAGNNMLACNNEWTPKYAFAAMLTKAWKIAREYAHTFLGSRLLLLVLFQIVGRNALY